MLSLICYQLHIVNNIFRNKKHVASGFGRYED